MTRTCIIVLGMHRSGTSALTRALNLCGAHLPGQMMENTEGNASGHWEPLEVVALHDQLLAQHHYAWDDVGVPLSDTFMAPAVHTAQQAIETFLQSSTTASHIAIKDPRMCYTLPVWREPLQHHGLRPTVLFATRHPLAVAKSLYARNAMPLAYGLLLWLHHTLLAEYYSRSWERMVVHYDQLIQHWRGTLDPVTEWLGMPVASHSAHVCTQLDAFLQPSQRHHQNDEDEFAKLTEAHIDVVTTWKLCQQNLHDPTIQREFDDIRARAMHALAGNNGAVQNTLAYLRQRYHQNIHVRDAEITWRTEVQQQQATELAWRKQVMVDHKLEPKS